MSSVKASRDRAAGITVVGASAGSGKTHHLTEHVLAAVDGGTVPIDGLLAVTYTKRAQLELASRLRQKLLRSGGDAGRAALLPLANVGTVHAACLRLLRELALDAGFSPDIEVLSHEERLLHEVLEETLETPMLDELLALATRMAIGRDQAQHVDWVPTVVDVMTLARHGRIAPADLAAMADRSIAGLLSLLPLAANDDLDSALALAIDTSLDLIVASGCSTVTTRKALELLRKAKSGARRGPVDWPTWCALGKLDVGKLARPGAGPVRDVAVRVLEHPRLRADMARFTLLVFDAAARVLVAYQEAKARRGVVDYVDMIDGALALLDDPAIAADLAARLRLVVVDELQDSSPIQLALFLRWHQLAGASRWVGDPKQCIFEYAGADPALMDATIRWVGLAGGAAERLEENHRSRPELVRACNALFASAFARHGLARGDVEVHPVREVPASAAKLPPFGLWQLETKKQAEDALAIAEGIRGMLAQAVRTPVIDRATMKPRSVRAGDVAVLVATNAEAERIAAALASHGIEAALARSGVLDTPEGVALHAALALLVDSWGERERAVLEALHGFGDGSPDAWLSARIRGETERKAARDLAEEAGVDPEPPTREPADWERRLDLLRPRLTVLSPAETVDEVIAALDLAALCARWPDARQRLANIDALRALAVDYEGRCADLAEGASVAGLFRFFEELTTPVFLRGEKLDADAQAEARGEHAVTVLTYHRSKGLEWPVVVLGSLDRDVRRTPFDVVPETDAATLDPDAPLHGRWIRYWPWPFPHNATNPLRDAAERSPPGKRVASLESRERVRLLYVGFTRARDHLILCRRGDRLDWLRELRTPDGAAAIVLPATDDKEPVVRIVGPDGEATFGVRVTRVEPIEPESPGDVRRTWFLRGAPSETSAPYGVVPSSAKTSGFAWPSLVPGAVARLHAPLMLEAEDDVPWATVGDAIHAFLACDLPGLGDELRHQRAQRLLSPVGLGGGLGDDASIARVIEASDSFTAWVQAHFPGAVWRREVPVVAHLDTEEGERRIAGSIDLLLELPDGGVVIIDHKSDRVTEAGGWRARTIEHAPQLSAYRVAVEAAGRRVAGTYVHFVVGGGVVEVVGGEGGACS